MKNYGMQKGVLTSCVVHHKGKSGIGYNMIISCELVVQLGLMANFKRQVLQRDGSTVQMKAPTGLLGKLDLINRNIRKVVMKTS